MDTGFDYELSKHLQAVAEKCPEEVETLANSFLKEGTKVVIVEAPVKYGKTSLAAALAKHLQELSQPWEVFFTLPGLQDHPPGQKILFAPKDKTGICYNRLPSLEEITKFSGKTLIVIDEISSNSPFFINAWKGYIDLDNTAFLLLTHPSSGNLVKWEELFTGEKSEKYLLTEPIKVAAPIHKF